MAVPLYLQLATTVKILYLGKERGLGVDVVVESGGFYVVGWRGVDKCGVEIKYLLASFRHGATLQPL